MKESQYIRFELLSAEASLRKPRKTVVWEVMSLSNTPLGTVKWYGAWRGYAFYPVAGTLLDCDCLFTIAQFCERQTTAHKSRIAGAC